MSAVEQDQPGVGQETEVFEALVRVRFTPEQRVERAVTALREVGYDVRDWAVTIRQESEPETIRLTEVYGLVYAFLQRLKDLEG